MAKFNPDLPEQQLEYYGRLSKPISPVPGQQKAADISTGQALTGIGDVLESAAKVSDILARDVIAEKAEGQFGPLVKQHTQDVAQVRDAVYGSKLAQATPQQADDTDPSAVPPVVTRAIGRAADLNSFRASGKMSETQYKGEVDKLHSDTRAQIPQVYRKFYDRKVAEITGIAHTANEYVASMIGDINAAMAKKSDDHNRIDAHVIAASTADPSLIHDREAWKAGKMSDEEILTKSARAQNAKYSLEFQKLALSAQEETQKANTRAAGRYMAEEASTQANNDVVNLMDRMGFKDAVKNPETMAKFYDDLSKDPEKANAFKTAVEASKLAGIDRLQKSWTQPGRATKNNPEGKSVMEISGWSQETANTAASNAYVWHDAVSKYIGGDASAITYLARQTKALEDKNTAEALEDPSLRRRLLAINTLEKLGGGQALPNLLLKNSDFLRLPEDLVAHREEKDLYSLTQPGRNVYTDLKDGTAKGRELGHDDSELGTLTDSYPKRALEIIPNPAVAKPIRENAVQYNYGPKGAGMFAAFQDRNADYYSQFFDPKITTAIKRDLSTTAWNTYKDRAQSAFSAEIATPLVKKMNTMAEDPAIRINFDDSDPAHPFNYDQGDIKNVVGNTKRGIAHPYDRQIEDLNKAYRAIADQDVTKYAFGVFRALGASDKVAQMFARAMEASAAKPKPTLSNP